MIIFDYSAIFHMNLNQIMKFNKGEVSEGLLRHMVLSSMRVALEKNKEHKDEVIIACDDRHYWRKEFFPEYKASRKQNRQSDGKDWDTIFTYMHNFKEELRTYFPYIVMQVDTAEADDIIACLVERFAPSKQIIIVSPDKDLLQLQKYDTVGIYDPKKKHHVLCDDPIGMLHELILRGDDSDGIPNFLSPDNAIVNKIRQKPIKQNMIDEMREITETEFHKHIIAKYPQSYIERNIKCIDLSFVPGNIREKVNHLYDDYTHDTHVSLEEYFDKYQLKKLKERIGDF